MFGDPSYLMMFAELYSAVMRHLQVPGTLGASAASFLADGVCVRARGSVCVCVSARQCVRAHARQCVCACARQCVCALGGVCAPRA